MVNYQNGKIYCIRSRSRPELVYVGSTTQTLSKRLGKHKAPSNHCSSKQIVAVGDAYIELIETHPCDNKEQLLRREGQIMRSMTCVNERIAGPPTPEELRTKYKQKYHNHKERICVLQKHRYQQNKEKICAEQRHRYKQNREAVLARHKQAVECQCGATTKGGTSKHRRTAKHQFWLQTNNFIYS